MENGQTFQQDQNLKILFKFMYNLVDSLCNVCVALPFFFFLVTLQYFCCFVVFLFIVDVFNSVLVVFSQTAFEQRYTTVAFIYAYPVKWGYIPVDMGRF